MKHIAILDFGSQYTHLIARSIRELKVLAKIYPHDISAGKLKKAGAEGVILSGGPQSVYAKNSLSFDKEIFNLGVPILGLCYGHQLIAHLLGGKVKPGKIKEYGSSRLEIKKSNAIFKGIKNKTEAWMSHGDAVSALPKGFETIGETSDCPVTAMACEAKKIYGFQFHPEVAHTEEGAKMIQNFVLNVCQSEKSWRIKNIIQELCLKIKKQVGRKKVFILTSGGVDSNVAFALLSKALGKKRALGLYIDTGFMRQNESREIISNFKKIGFDNIKTIDAGHDFFSRLKEIYEPEEKRKIIGQAFLDAKDKVSKELKLNEREWLLGQGTIYPDTIESGATKNADKIKTHHNRIDAITKMIEKGLVVEPLVDFYKDEVMAIGKLLELPDDLISRHPFPGPGLAIRCLCLKKGKKFSLKKKVKKDLEKFYAYGFPGICFDVLPIKSVGVQGDNRTYAHPAVIWGESSWEKLAEISSQTTNNFKDINRVMFLVSSESKKFLLSEKNKYLTLERIELLRKIDAIVDRNIRKAGIYKDIRQFPVVLVPITDERGRESIVLRPVVTRDFMTLKFYRMDKKIMFKISREIMKTKKVGHVFYDITNKPPGTTEWE